MEDLYFSTANCVELRLVVNFCTLCGAILRLGLFFFVR